jgi:toxin ParE1/3/4
MNGARDDLRPGIRAFPVGDYLILYREAGADVAIVRVVHGSRDLAALF